MNRYVLKINDSTYVSSIHWIGFQIPHEIKTSDLQGAMIVTDEYLNQEVLSEYLNRKGVILRYFPHVKIVKIKIVEDEEQIGE